MTDVTLKSLADEIQTSADRLVQQFADAGILKSVHDSVSMREKLALLAYLNRKHGSLAPNKLTLQRKTRSTLNIPGIDGKNKSIQIEIRKSRVFIKRDIPKVDHLTIQEDQNKQAQSKAESIILQSETEFKNKCEKSQNLDKEKHNLQDQTKRNIVENKKVSSQSISTADNIIAEKICSGNSDTNLKYRSEEKPRYVFKDTRCIKKERRKNNIIAAESIEYFSNRRFTTSSTEHICQIDNNSDNKHGIDNDHNRNRNRNRNRDRDRDRDRNRDRHAKSSREEIRVITCNGKGVKRKDSIIQQGFQKPVHSVNRNVVIGETITVSELASKMAVKGSCVIKAMIKLGVIATINQVIDQETAQLIVEEMGHNAILRRENELEEALLNDRNTGGVILIEPRSPVVTVMGHVDHGKTSLLDYIRSAKVASSEAGGITQHIGAYHVKIDKSMITFLDTPGHAAFTAMRSRGAQITDIVVLVVAADDGVMPQTIEAIQHAKAANVPMVIAINKIDKPDADPDRVKNELLQYGIFPEEWGGETQVIYISAKLGTGVDKLLDAILLQSELLELKARRTGMASGIVIESFLDKGRGPIATILVREGILRKGDILLCGFEYGRIRAMRNEFGEEVLEAGPSTPVEILGLSGVPDTGNVVTVVRNEKKAREVALYRYGKFRELQLAQQQKSKLKNIFSNITNNDVHVLHVVLKADVQGSVEAISDSLLKLSTKEIKIKIIGSSVGSITETDVTLAAASNAILIGFNVRADASARRAIEAENLELRYYSVIYNLINEMKETISNLLSPKIKQKTIGLAEVREVFKSLKFGTIAGCIVIEGMIKRHNAIRILRKNIVVYEGKFESLRRFKEDVSEVRNSMECGIGVKNYNDIRIGDIIEVFETIEI